VRAWEGGTVLDAVPAASSSSLDVGSRGAAATIWPEDAGPLPTADRPTLAMVLVPAGDASEAGAQGQAPTWVFPFNRPLPPADGDNQALVVNTEDGAVAYDVSFALVWADEGSATNRNEAYAFASCRNCRTVAVAFQVVMLVGSVDVVVPENIAAAVNYACVECVTYALATQLVVSLPGPLSEEGSRELAEIWAELAEFGATIEDVPLGELRARLTEFETRILAVVREDAEGAEGAGSEDAGEPAGESGAAEDGSGEPAAPGDGDSSPAPATTSGGAAPSSGSAPTSEAPPTGTGSATSSSTAPTGSATPTASAPG
jgi:putative peptide zinc metalloprotease protein